MPSTGSALRAPLLWLLLPFMGGIAIADACPGAPARMALLAIAAAASAGLGYALARVDRRGLPALSLAAIVGAGGIAGFLSQRLHAPTLAGWESTPREVLVTVEVAQVFPESSSRKSVNGIGRITAADIHVAEITGQFVYFSAIRRISVPPLRSGRYSVRGVLQARPATTGEPSGFDRYLDSRGIKLTLTRAQLVSEVRAPGVFARFCAASESRLEAILERGVARHAEAVAIYLGMLLGERAVLSEEQQDAFKRSGTFHILSCVDLPPFLAHLSF